MDDDDDDGACCCPEKKRFFKNFLFVVVGSVQLLFFCLFVFVVSWWGFRFDFFFSLVVCLSVLFLCPRQHSLYLVVLLLPVFCFLID